jgi:hypothetical protein|tara:strand:- start:87 stop:287 length:201 start_codon:yes stop_codon:yes gene_type:complete
MDWSQVNELEEIDLEFNKNPKRVRFENSEEKNISYEFDNKLNELLKIQERINVLINELHILYTFKQ